MTNFPSVTSTQFNYMVAAHRPATADGPSLCVDYEHHAMMARMNTIATIQARRALHAANKVRRAAELSASMRRQEGHTAAAAAAANGKPSMAKRLSDVVVKVRAFDPGLSCTTAALERRAQSAQAAETALRRAARERALEAVRQRAESRNIQERVADEQRRLVAHRKSSQLVAAWELEQTQGGDEGSGGEGSGGEGSGESGAREGERATALGNGVMGSLLANDLITLTRRLGGVALGAAVAATLPPVLPVPKVTLAEMHSSLTLVLRALTHKLHLEASDAEIAAAHSAFRSWHKTSWLDPRDAKVKLRPKHPPGCHALLSLSHAYALSLARSLAFSLARSLARSLSVHPSLSLCPCLSLSRLCFCLPRA